MSVTVCESCGNSGKRASTSVNVGLSLSDVEYARTKSDMCGVYLRNTATDLIPTSVMCA